MKETQLKEKLLKAIHESVKELDSLYINGDMFSTFLSGLDAYNIYTILSKQNSERILNTIASEQDCAMDFISLVYANITINGLTDNDISKIVLTNHTLLKSNSLGKEFTNLLEPAGANDMLLNIVFIIKLNLKTILFQYSAMVDKNKNKDNL